MQAEKKKLEKQYMKNPSKTENSYKRSVQEVKSSSQQTQTQRKHRTEQQTLKNQENN